MNKKRTNDFKIKALNKVSVVTHAISRDISVFINLTCFGLFLFFIYLSFSGLDDERKEEKRERKRTRNSKKRVDRRRK